MMVKEHSSQCNSDQFVVTHNALELDVDFGTKTISGTVEVIQAQQLCTTAATQFLSKLCMAAVRLLSAVRSPATCSVCEGTATLCR